MKHKKLFWMISIIFILSVQLFADEGMYPVSEIKNLNLADKGLIISPSDIYNPKGVSIVNGICKVGGATGSFISKRGLIITNHHVAYGAIQAASTPEHDYITNGYYAHTAKDEIPAKGYVVRITDSYKDVSKDVLKAATKNMTFQQRAEAIEKKIKKIVADAEKFHPGKRAAVSEMFPGKTYVLFIYTFLKDIRLVFAPPRAVGNFGGEIDNWMWPRHTGDFSLLRAYVAPDGSPASYSKENIPFAPKKVLKINPKGTSENDFVFMLGYPGRTYRNRTSSFLAYEYNFYMPWIADYYQWEINLLKKISKKDRATAIKLATKIKWRSNTMKNYRGKLLGIKRLDLIDRKKNEEHALQHFIESRKDLDKKYSSLLENINGVYKEMSSSSDRELILRYLRSSPFLISAAFKIYEGSAELKKHDLDRKAPYMKRNIKRTEDSIRRGFDNFHTPSDKAILTELLLKAAALPDGQRIEAVEKIAGKSDRKKSIKNFVDHIYSGTSIINAKIALDAMYSSPDKNKVFRDPALVFVSDLYPEYKKLEKVQKYRKGKLDQLLASFMDVKKLFMKKNFIPDANGTLRFTYGKVEGYSPKDAVWYRPFTTLKGITEKNTGKFPFDAPKKLLNLIRTKQPQTFLNPQLKTVPVDMLYSTDTTGGNSGSPIFNARGELIGINFDRAFEATINDFAWSKDYSRSIGVDIRYVLWILKEFSGAESILKELEIQI